MLTAILFTFPLLSHSYLDQLTQTVISDMQTCMNTKNTTPSTNCTTQAITFLSALYSAIAEVRSYSTNPQPKPFPGVSTGVLYLSASTVLDGYSTPPRARIDLSSSQGSNAWCAGVSAGAWIQASSPVPYNFTRLELRGSVNNNSYVSSYSIRYSSDGITWTQYKNGATFTGGTVNTAVINQALEPFTARAIRVYPLSGSSTICCKIETIIIKAGPTNILPAGALIAAISCGFVVRTTSSRNPMADSTRINLNNANVAGTNAWCAEFNDLNNWVMIGSFNNMSWSKIDIQGGGNANAWVNTFQISYTVDGEKWYYYNNQANITANSDASTVVTANLTPFTAIAIRIIPITWTTSICMRMEAYCSEV